MPVRPLVMLPLLLLFGMALTSCTAPQSLPPRVEVHSPHIDSGLLTCLPRPGRPVLETQADLVDHLAVVDVAGQDCREKLNSVKTILEENK